MALIKCPECGKEISDKAASCPNCGYRSKKNNVTIIFFVIIFSIIIAIFIISLINKNFFNQASRGETPKNETEDNSEENFCTVTVSSGNMENTIRPGETIILDQRAYADIDPERKDIVLFSSPLDADKENLHLSRIIGLPGETLEIRNAQIYIDDSETPLEEDYLKEEWTVLNDGFTFQIPEDCYLMLGDNRNNSSDSRYWPGKALQYGAASTEEEAIKFSFVPEEDILGKIIIN